MDLLLDQYIDQHHHRWRDHCHVPSHIPNIYQIDNDQLYIYKQHIVNDCSSFDDDEEMICYINGFGVNNTTHFKQIYNKYLCHFCKDIALYQKFENNICLYFCEKCQYHFKYVHKPINVGDRIINFIPGYYHRQKLNSIVRLHNGLQCFYTTMYFSTAYGYNAIVSNWYYIERNHESCYRCIKSKNDRLGVCHDCYNYSLSLTINHIQTYHYFKLANLLVDDIFNYIYLLLLHLLGFYI
ncbi:MAG TPA: hypothetical protein VLG50_05860 [Candidatus Saccharimonadales bacterium]|nr:hypothetical protein [Candidatus Saccharimonadales bacterium]